MRKWRASRALSMPKGEVRVHMGDLGRVERVNPEVGQRFREAVADLRVAVALSFD